MELLSKTTQVIKVVESRVQVDSGTVVVIKDYYDETDKIIDAEVRTKDGYEMDDLHEIAEVLEFLDGQE